MRSWLLLSSLVLAIYAQSAPSPAYAPRPDDAKLTRGKVFIDRTSVEAGVLVITGNLPSPCHEIRVKAPTSPDASGAAAIEVWSVFEGGKMCTQMLAPFSIKVPLTAELAKAKLVVNGKPAGLPTE